MTPPLDPTIRDAIDRGLDKSQSEILKAGIVGKFDALFEAEGPVAYVHMVHVLLERLEQKIAAKVVSADLDSGWAA